MKPSEKALIKAKRAEKRNHGRSPSLFRTHLKTRIKYGACLAGYILLPVALWLTPESLFSSGFATTIHILRWATVAVAVIASFFLVHVIIHPEWAVKKDAVKGIKA
jgi:hypothetical protein